MKPHTAFSFGYWGWGTSTAHLLRAVDAVERSRGFRPPVFVDIRIRREVRATGFSGRAFEEKVGPRRYRWMRGLGNKRILTGSGPPIQILNPKAAEDLLDLILEAYDDSRRVIYFCSCQYPRNNEGGDCHRHRVGALLLRAAGKRKVSLEVVEWPGGEPMHLDIDVSPETFRAVAGGRMTIPMGEPRSLAKIAGLAWGSTATLRLDDRELHRLVAAAIWTKEQWCLPVAGSYWTDPDVALERYQRSQNTARRKFGMLSRSCAPPR